MNLSDWTKKSNLPATWNKEKIYFENLCENHICWKTRNSSTDPRKLSEVISA